jgi:branched-chain amino acid transport system permease protein
MRKSLILSALVLAIAALCIVNDFAVTVVGFACIYALFVMGLNIFMGYTGQASFGQNAFAAIGGYASAVLTTAMGWSPVAGIVVGGFLAAAVALIVAVPTLRLKGHYLAMATLGLGMITHEVAINWQSVTMGFMGISGIPPLSLAGYELASERAQLVAIAIVTALGMWLLSRIRQSRLGRALIAISGSEDAARALGVEVTRYKVLAFVIAAVYSSISGSLFAHFVGFISPEVFGMHMVVLGFTMLYVGGIGTAIGPIIGALIISWLPETFRSLHDFQNIVYGVALVAILIYAPRGLAPVLDFLLKPRQPRPAPIRSDAK